MLGNTSLWCH